MLYDSSILAATGVIFTPLLGDPDLFEVFNDFDLSVPGTVDFAQVVLAPMVAIAVARRRVSPGGLVTW